MNPELRKQLQTLLDSGRLSPGDAEEARRALATHDEPASAGNEAPELMGMDVEAGQVALARQREDRRAALDAGEADMQFESNRRGEPDMKAPGLADRSMAMMGIDPATRAMIALRQNPGYMKERAELGDKDARFWNWYRDSAGKVSGLVNSTVGGSVMGPASSALGALARGGAAGGAGAATEGMVQRDAPADLARRTGTGAGVGALMSLLMHGVGAAGAAGQRVVRENPDTGPDVQIAEARGYETKLGRGLRPRQPTGRLPGKRGVEEEAAAIAPDAMKRADATDDALRAAHQAADEAFYASEVGKKTVDSTPIIQAFRKLIAARSFESGDPIPESAWARLTKDAESFGKTVRVPIEHADEVAEKAGGVVLRRQLGPASGERAIPVTPGGRAVVPGAEAAPGEPIPMGPGARQMPGPDTAMVKAAPPGQVGSTRPGPAKAPTPVTPDGYTPPGGKADSGQQYATVLVPRQLNARELEAVRNTFDAVGNAANRTTEDTAPLMEIANTARGMRKGFPGLEEMRAGQSSEVARIKNIRKAMGIPEAKRLNAEDLAELRQVGDALERYKAPGNLEADRVIDDFLAKNPDFQARFDKLAGMSAAERVRGSSPSSRVNVGKGGTLGTLRETLLGGMLRIDPAMAALAKLRGIAAPAGGAAGAAAGGVTPELADFFRQMIGKKFPETAEAQP